MGTFLLPQFKEEITMKKLFSIVAVIFFMLVMATQVQAAGAIATPSKSYIYCRNVSDQTVDDGEVVFWATGTSVGYGYDVTFCAGASSSLVAGIIADTDIKNDRYGNIQVSGYHSVVKVKTNEHPIAIGDGLIPSNAYGVCESNESKAYSQIVALESEAVNQIGHYDYSQVTSGTDQGVLKDRSTCPTVKAIIKIMGSPHD